MIHWLAPAALFGLSLLAIPVIVHLFQPRRVRQTPFSSLRWLHLTQQRLARRIKWHQILLFLLRAGFLTLLVLALAQPYFSSGGQDGGKGLVERFIVIDQSASMRYAEADGRTPLDEARRFAEQLVRRGGPGDRTAVLLAGAQATVLHPLDNSAAAALPRIRQIAPTWESTHLSAALPIIQSLLTSRRPEAEVQLYFLTDQQQQSWDAAEVHRFAAQVQAPVQTHIINLGSPAPRNAWISDLRVQRDPQSSGAVLTVEVAAVGDRFTRSIRLSGADGSLGLERSVDVGPGRRNVVQFSLPSLPERTAALTVRLDPSDALPCDDVAQVLIPDTGAPRLLVVYDETAAPAVHLPTAVRALGQTHRRVEVRVQSAQSVSPADLAGADAVALLSSKSLPSSIWQELEQLVRQGAGLLVFTGPDADIAALNASGLLPGDLASTSAPAPDADAPGTNVRWDMPALADRQDPQIGDIGQVRVRRSFRYSAALPAGAQVVARLGDGAPLVTTHSLGQGRVVTILTDPSDAWWDMPRRAAFLPFTHAMLNELVGSPVPLRIEPADAVTLWLDAGDATEASSVLTDPEGVAMTVQARRVGDRWRLQLPPADVPGVYIWQGEPVLVVNPAWADAQVSQANGDALAEMWNPVPVQLVQSPTERQALLKAQSRLAIGPVLLLLACLLLLAEMYLVHRLCPRIQPVVVTPMVRRGRGFHAGTHHAEGA